MLSRSLSTAGGIWSQAYFLRDGGLVCPNSKSHPSDSFGTIRISIQDGSKKHSNNVPCSPHITGAKPLK